MDPKVKEPHKDGKKLLIERFWVAPVLDAVNNIYDPIPWQLTT